jgi:SAM-dependent methyltransferase
MTENAPASDVDGDRLESTEQRIAVRERYTRIATESSCCSDTTTTCGEPPEERSQGFGYSDDDLDAVDGNANWGLGCGNPTAIADLEEGDTVLDLGSGGGFDCFLAAREVGSDGQVIGVDMTPEMVEKARTNVEANDVTNVEFRLGEIEHLPVADESVDVILSNCVVNLSPDKPRVFREAFRVLRPGGRLAISDVVLIGDLPDGLRTDPESVVACVGGTSSISALETILAESGFAHVSVEPDTGSEEFVRDCGSEGDSSDRIVAASIEAEKPTAEPRS